MEKKKIDTWRVMKAFQRPLVTNATGEVRIS